MGIPQPIELRERIVRAHEEQGIAVDEIADLFGVSSTSIRRYLTKSAEGSSLAPRVPPGAKPKLSDSEYEWLRGQLQANPYLTSYELCERFNKRFDSNTVHRSTILRAMHKLGFTYKKKHRSRPSANARMSGKLVRSLSRSKNRYRPRS